MRGRESGRESGGNIPGGIVQLFYSPMDSEQRGKCDLNSGP
jgi:hypothetical protein